MSHREPSRVRVRTLLRHSDVALMLGCWKTLVRCSADTFETVVHDDGSLTSEDEASIRAAIPNARVLWRAEADALMAGRLARHAHAAEFRRTSIWGLKLLDVALAEPGDCYYVDSDMRFMRPFHGLFCADALAGRSVFLRDTVWTAYSIRPWHLLGARNLKVVEAINTGLTLIDARCYDVDFVDWFLGQPDWRVIPAWTEPTCWAALAARTDGHAVNPRQITNLYPRARIDERTVGVHWLSAYRSAFANVIDSPVAEASPVPFELIRLRLLTATGLGLNQMKRKLRNEFDRLTRSP